MKNQKLLNKIIMMVIVLVSLPMITVHAESPPATYSIETVEDTLTNSKGETIAIISYEKLVLDGKTEAIKKINKSIKKDCTKNFREYKHRVFSYAKDYIALNDQYYYQVYCNVTYNDNDVISLKMTWYWYAGGVSNSSSYGLTYDLKTGDKLELTDVVEGSSSKIKNKIVKATEKYINTINEDGWWSDNDIQTALDQIKSYDLNDFEFFLKGKKVYICYDQYEILRSNFGGDIIGIKAKTFQ